MDVDERIDASTAETMRSITDESGKPARTSLEALAHLRHSEGASNSVASGVRCRSADASGTMAEVNISFLAISIHTGRRHQIRAHTRHVGHPTVTDGRYAPRDVILSV